MAFQVEVAKTISWFYAAAFGRTPVPNSAVPFNGDLQGLTFWTHAFLAGEGNLAGFRGNLDAIGDFFVASTEFQTRFPSSLTNEQFVTALYNNMLGRAPDLAGFSFWVQQLNSGESRGAVLVDFANTEENQGAVPNQSEALDSFILFIANDTDQTITPEEADVWLAANPTFDASVIDGGVTPPPTSTELTLGRDHLVGTAGDNTFFAPVVQNDTGSGQLANTFETGDRIDGAGGRNTLHVDLIDTGSVGAIAGPAISATTMNVQEVYFRQQSTRSDNPDSTTPGSTIDAERMAGVEQWWTQNSRSTVQIEDIRTRPADTAFGMQLTDPQVGYTAYFNPFFVEGGTTDTESALTVVIQEITDGQAPATTQLANITVRELNFSLGGVDYSFDTPEMRAADTWADLATALAAALEAQFDDRLTVEHRGNGVFVIEDSQSGTFEVSASEALIFGAAADIDVRNRVEVGEPVFEEAQTRTTVILDGVGNGSRGGDLVIGAMSGDRGVEVFDVEVGRNSHLSSMRSTNSEFGTSFTQQHQLEEVYVSHLSGASGSLQIGLRTVTGLGASTTTDNRLQTQGLTDVRVFDASGFNAPLKVGAQLTNNVFVNYLDGVEDTVQFSYLLGDGGSNLSLFVNNQVSGDPDFALEIIGGAGDDRINLTGLAVKNSTSINGGAGANIVEVDSSTGGTPGTNAPGTAFAEFQNIQTLVVRNSQHTVQNVVVGNMPGLSDIVVASTGVWNTELRQVNVSDTTITLSGKNQTLGDASNANQALGVIAINGSTGQEADILLDNTARVNGVFTIAALNVGDFGTLQSEIRTLNLESGGARDTSNIVQSFSGPRVTTLNLEGTQDLAIHVANMATLPVTAGQTPPMTIDGSTLEGNLTLAMNAAMLARGNLDVVTGTAGDADTLQVYGVNPTAATVSGFETIQLGAPFAAPGATFSGTYNAANTTDVELYSIQNLGAATAVTNLGGTVNALVNAATVATNQNITFAAGTQATGNILNIEFRGDVYASTLTTTDFRTVNIQLTGDVGGVVEDDTFAFNVAPNAYARTLTFTGGGDQGAAGIAGGVDVLTLATALQNSLTTIDFSGFVGRIGAVTLDPALVPADQSNTTIRMNGYDAVITDTVATQITTFRFTTDAVATTEDWEILGFRAFNDVAGVNGLTNLSVLDLRDLGVQGLADITIDDTSAAAIALGGTIITSNDGLNFEIGLVGVTALELSNENFAFAV